MEKVLCGLHCSLSGGEKLQGKFPSFKNIRVGEGGKKQTEKHERFSEKPRNDVYFFHTPRSTHSARAPLPWGLPWR